MSSSNSDIGEWVFRVFGFVVGLGTFLGCWGYAISSWGWFLGLAFGWVPSVIIAIIAVVLSPLLFLFLIGLVILLISLYLYG